MHSAIMISSSTRAKRWKYVKFYFLLVGITLALLILEPRFDSSYQVNVFQVNTKQTKDCFVAIVSDGLQQRVNICNNLSPSNEAAANLNVSADSVIQNVIQNASLHQPSRTRWPNTTETSKTTAANPQPTPLIQMVDNSSTDVAFYPLYPSLEPYSVINPIHGFSKTSQTILLSLRGRFGNHLFQIATLFSFALQTGRIPVVIGRISDFNRLIKFFTNIGDSIMFICENVNKTGPVLISERLLSGVSKILVGQFQHIQEEHPGCFDYNLTQQLLASKVQHVSLCCFFSSWKYFLPFYAREIGALLQINEEYRTSAEKRMHGLLFEKFGNGTLQNIQTVGVHVRRGDLVRFKSLKEEGRNVADTLFFRNAMDHFRKKYDKIIFVITGNIDAWTYANLNMSDSIITASNNFREDFTLLTLCDDAIMTVGTFGWWAAYLAGGQTVYFADYAAGDSIIARGVCDTDTFLPEWTKY